MSIQTEHSAFRRTAMIEPRVAFPRRRVAVALIALLAVAAAAMSAARAGLYPRAAPPGSAFIRGFNATAAAGVELQIADQHVKDIGAYAGTAFVFVAPGHYAVQFAGHTQDVALLGDHYYTAVALDKNIKLIEQPKFDSQLKAQLGLFNLIDGATLSLRTGDGKITIINGVASDAYGQREVNPVNVALAVYSGDDKLGDVHGAANLQRGVSYSVFALGSPASPVLAWVGQ